MTMSRLEPEQSFLHIEKEWIQLINAAKQIGLTPDEVRSFLNANKTTVITNDRPQSDIFPIT